MDEFYLPEETAEWIGLKKSEYLSKLIENIAEDDFQFEEYSRFDEQIPVTLTEPDWSAESTEAKQKLKTYCRTFSDNGKVHQVVIGVIITDQKQNDVYVPIISFVTRKQELVNLFFTGPVEKPTLN